MAKRSSLFCHSVGDEEKSFIKFPFVERKSFSSAFVRHESLASEKIHWRHDNQHIDTQKNDYKQRLV
jgi:hypothetical protein